MIDPAAMLVLAIMTPAAGVILAVALGGRAAGGVALVVAVAGAALALGITGTLWNSGTPLHYVIGGWSPPLGVALRADGLSAIMLLTSALVIGAIAAFAGASFTRPPGQGGAQVEARMPLVFWVMLMGVWTGLNAVWLAADLCSL